MAQKFYSEHGEKDHLSPKLLKISRESTEGCKIVYIPELRLTVFTKFNETVQQTRERYLSKTLTYSKLEKSSDEKPELVIVDVVDDDY